MKKIISRFTFVLFFVIQLSFSQNKMEKIEIIKNKVEIDVPKDLALMSDEMWTLKYQGRPKPTLALSDKNAEINLIADLTQQPATESQLSSFKDFQINSLKKKRPDLQIVSQGVKTINGKKIAYFKFISDAIDQKVFNYYFFTIVDGKILFFTFNCIEKFRPQWEKTSDEIVASLKIK